MKNVCAILILLLLSSGIYAQSELHFGLKAAPALSWIRTDSPDYKSDGSNFGFTYGLITEFNFAEKYAFATGFDIASQGGKLKSIFNMKNVLNKDSIVTVESSFSLKYVELPLTLKLKTTEIGYVCYYLQIGLAPGLCIRAHGDVDQTIQDDGVNLTPSHVEDVDILDDINSFNLSMIIGGGLEYTLSGSTTLLAGIQFNNGFVDISDRSELKANCNYLALNLGILF